MIPNSCATHALVSILLNCPELQLGKGSSYLWYNTHRYVSFYQIFCWIWIRIHSVAESGSNPNSNPAPVQNLLWQWKKLFKGHSSFKRSSSPKANSSNMKMKVLFFHIWGKILNCLDLDSAFPPLLIGCIPGQVTHCPAWGTTLPEWTRRTRDSP